MTRSIEVSDFEAFRTAARALAMEGIHPREVTFVDGAAGQRPLFGEPVSQPTTTPRTALKVPVSFLKRAEYVALHREHERWNLLYRVLYRLNREQPHLLSLPSDPDVRLLETLERAVRKDEHRMHAFVRFRQVQQEGGDVLVAWYAPEHRVLRRCAEFFQQRFAPMRWSLLTPDESAHWDTRALTFGPGVARADAPDQDAVEALWHTYYASVFNPARLNLAAMRRDMPLRYWSSMPELRQVPTLVSSAPRRTAQMLAEQRAPAAAEPFLPPPPQRSLSSLANALKHCTACPVHARTTQAVSGEGPAHAQVVLVGEQPGDLEDVQGRPFVGPAGQVLDDALRAAGLDRSGMYVTNAVKHFHWAPSDRPGDKRRIHQRPGRSELQACKPWLEAEVAAVKPRFLVCLGATAAQAMLGHGFKLTHSRGQVFSTPEVPWLMATWHPSAVLRSTDEGARATLYDQLVSDLLRLKAAMREPNALVT